MVLQRPEGCKKQVKLERRFGATGVVAPFLRWFGSAMRLRRSQSSKSVVDNSRGAGVTVERKQGRRFVLRAATEYVVQPVDVGDVTVLDQGRRGGVKHSTDDPLEMGPADSLITRLSSVRRRLFPFVVSR